MAIPVEHENIGYDSNNKSTFNGNIDSAISNLKKAEKETRSLQGLKQPHRTIIGRRFNKKSVIEQCKSSIGTCYNSLSSVQSSVQDKVNEHILAEKKVNDILKNVNLNMAPSYMQGTTQKVTNNDELNWAYSYQGGGTTLGGYKGYNNLTWKDLLNGLKKTGATLVNGIDAFSEGATEMFFGGSDKAFELGGRLVTSPYYALKDAWIYASSGGKKKGNNLKNAWSSTMEYVAEPSLIEKQHSYDHQQESYKKFDKNVYDPFKYEKGGYKVVKTLGGIFGAAAGPSVITGAPAITAAGFGTKFVPTASTGLTAGARGTSEYWQGKKKNSMEGIKEAYNYGEITEEQYKNIIEIRNISDSQWEKIEKEINKSIENGMKKSDPIYKQYLQMKDIREMPKDWKSDKVLIGGLKYGAATALWETTQFAAGSHLSDFVKSPFTRIAINTSFNALDPVTRAAAMSQIDKTSFLKEFEAQGGTGAVFLSGIVGLAGSTIGELPEIKAEMQRKKLYALLNEQPGNSFNYAFDQQIRNNLARRGSYSATDRNFQYTQEVTGDYGVNQGVFDKMYYFRNKNTGEIFYAHDPRYQECLEKGISLEKVATIEYFEFKKLLQNKYGMNKKTASTIMSAIDSKGACSYASAANDIVAHYKDFPQEFEKIFGFPLYKEINGVEVINDKELLADLYIFANSNRVNGVEEASKLLYKNDLGNIYVNYVNGEANIVRDRNGRSTLLDSVDQEYWWHSNGLDER